MNDAEARRAVDQARRAQRALKRDEHLMDAAMKADWDLERAGEALDLVFRVFDQVRQMVNHLGGAEGVREALGFLARALHDFYEALPPNWSGSLSIEQAVDLANAGVPVVWVPPSEVLAELASASDRQAQMAILQDHRVELHADVLRVLDEVTAQELEGQVTLARRSVDTWAAGHHEAAQALAVAVAETVLTRYFAKRRGYSKVAAAVALDDDALEPDPLSRTPVLRPGSPRRGVRHASSQVAGVSS